MIKLLNYIQVSGALNQMLAARPASSAALWAPQCEDPAVSFSLP